MVRRPFLLATCALAMAMAMAAACSFPEPALVVGDDDGGSDEASALDTQGARDAALADSVYSIDGNENVDPEGGAEEASTHPDGGLVLDASCADPCDCDKDGVRSEDASTCAPTGKDCDDHDPFVPHAGFVASVPSAGQNGDWDCDGIVTKQFAVNIDCGLLSDCSAQGFASDPGCGVAGQYVFCKAALPLVCVTDHTETRVQGCR